MSDNAKVVITLKGGPEYDAPWLVIHGDTVQEAGDLLGEIRSKGVMAYIQAAAAEFKEQKTDGAAVRAVQSTDPGAQVVSQNQELPDSMKPKCSECGTIGQPRKGTNSKGREYEGIFCPANKDHKPIEFRWLS